jgi:arsenate reductase-like glutaredoxin family protein
VNATKERFGQKDLKKLFADATSVTVAKGKKVQTFDLKNDPPAAAELAKVVLGPTGNLRAPAIKRGKAWLIGFNEDAYADALG